MKNNFGTLRVPMEFSTEFVDTTKIIQLMEKGNTQKNFTRKFTFTRKFGV